MVAVSIVICTRNRAQTISGTLRSLQAIRTEHDWDVLIVNNNSDDNTEEVIRLSDNCGGRLKYALASTIGLGAARDFGWRITEGEVVAFTDDDCYLAPDYVDAIVEAYARRPELGCIGGRIMLFDPDDAPVTINESLEPTSIPAYSFVSAGALQGANLSFRRVVLEAIGGFDRAFGAGTRFPCEDVDAVAAAVWSGFKAGYDPGPIVYHHHGRKPKNVPRLRRSYDEGRGAYYAKYILRQDSRFSYIQNWIRTSLSMWPREDGFSRLPRELKAAYHYCRSRGRNLEIAVALFPALLLLMFSSVSIAMAPVRRMLSRRPHHT